MKSILAVGLFLALISVSACTEKQRAKNFGGITTVEIDPGKKVVNVTWKENNMWILTRPRREDEIVETYEFKEDSSYGVVQGSVIIKEK